MRAKKFSSEQINLQDICSYCGCNKQCSLWGMLAALLMLFETYTDTAPLGSLVGNRWSCRVAVMLGGLLSSCGLLLSSFTNSLETLYFSLGVLTGQQYNS